MERRRVEREREREKEKDTSFEDIHERGLPCETPSLVNASSLFDGFPTWTIARLRRLFLVRHSLASKRAESFFVFFLALSRGEPWEFKLYSYRDNLQLSTSLGESRESSFERRSKALHDRLDKSPEYLSREEAAMTSTWRPLSLSLSRSFWTWMDERRDCLTEDRAMDR